nr:YDG domain-containing protein [Methylobacter tundripaludum]
MQVDQSVLNSLAENKQLIRADGGQVIMSAGAQNALLASVVNNEGVIEARTVENHDGTIVLLGGMEAGTVNVGGTLDASAPNGGNGGFIETSAAHVHVDDNAKITTQAANGNNGTWLIDPVNFTIAASGGDITGAALSGLLDANSVNIQTDTGTNTDTSRYGTSGTAGDIFVNDNVAKTTSSTTTLTLQAANNIIIAAGKSISSSLGRLNVVLNSDSDASGAGGILLNTGSSINSNGGNIVMGGGTNPTTGYAMGTAGSSNSGIHVLGDINAGAGDVTMHGQSALGNGITFAGGTLSSNGTVTIDGKTSKAGSSGAANNTAGVRFQNTGTRLTTVNGTVNVTGSSSGGNYSQGVTVDAATIETTGTGRLTLNGTTTAGSTSVWGIGINSNGVVQSTSTAYDRGSLNFNGVASSDFGIALSSGSITSNGGAINLTDQSSKGISVAGNINAGTGTVSLLVDSLRTCVTNAATCSTVAFSGAGHVTADTTTIYYNPTGSNASTPSYASPTDYTTKVTGTLNAYMLVNDVFQLQAMNTNLAGSYVQGKDIDASGTSTWNANAGFTPVGTLATPFTGIFDGLNHTITSLTINRPATDYVGLFGAVSSAGALSPAIRNVSLSGGSVVGRNYVGGLAGWNTNTDNANANISSSRVTGSVSGVNKVGGLVGKNDGKIVSSDASGNITGSGANSELGGLVGLNTGTISSSTASGSVSGIDYIGGLMGYNTGTVFSNHATGTVTGTGNYVGGLMGYNTGAVSGHYATGTVTGTGNYVGGLMGYNTGTVSNNYATGRVNGGSYVGGLIGGSTTSITDSYATGNVTGTGAEVGGLAGSSSGAVRSYARGSVLGQTVVGGLLGKNNGGTVSTSYAAGSVTGTSSTDVGGLVGHNSASDIDKSYATGSVTGTGNLGGLVGNNNTSAISNSYATGSVSGTGNLGGLVGLNASGTFAANFWDTTTTGQSVGVGGSGAAQTGTIGMTTADMQTRANFSSATTANGNENPAWDLTNTWVMYDGHTSPLLRTFMTALTVTARNAGKTYDGQAYSGGNDVTYSGAHNSNLLGTVSYSGTSQGATNAGSYIITPGALYSNQQGYIITYANGALTVNQKAVNLTGSRVYDGTANVAAGALTLGGLVGTETLALTGTGSLANKNVGTAKTLTLGTLALGNGTGLASNYTFTGGSRLVNVTAKALTVNGITANNKVYDGTTTATLAGTAALTGIIGTDAVTIAPGIISASFGDKNMGAGKAMSLSGVTLSGTDAGNYTLNGAASLTGIITAKALTVSGLTALNKVYDGNTTATLGGTAAISALGSDVVTLGGTATGAFADKNVAAGKAVTVSGLALSGADAGNYTVVQQPGLVADIIARVLSVSGISAGNKVYDGTGTATVNAAGATYTGLIEGDSLAVSATGTFADKNVGIGKTVTLASHYSGADVGNYSITDQASTVANISKKDLAVTGLTASHKTYDAAATAALTGNAAVSAISGDTVALGGTVNGAFADKNVGKGKAVTVTGNTIAGVDAGNYNLVQQTGLTADITKANLVVTGVTAKDKVYDANTTATLDGTAAVAPLSGDEVSMDSAGSGVFADANVGTDKAVTVSDFTLKGTDAGNYNVVQPAGLTATITAAPSTTDSGRPPEPVRNVTSQLTATLVSTTTSNQPVSYGQSSFNKEMSGSAQPPVNNESQGSGQDGGEQSSPSQSGNTTMTIGDNGSTLKVVNGGVKLPR